MFSLCSCLRGESIRHTGPREPTLDTLRGLVFAHATSVPFENLDVLLGRGVSLADDDVERKLVTDRRGGYCFEQNSLLLRALSALGFEATPLSARVRLQARGTSCPPGPTCSSASPSTGCRGWPTSASAG